MWETGVDSHSAGDFSPRAYREVSDRVHILWIGRLAPSKALPLLLDALRHISNRSGVRLSVVGDGPERERCERLVRARGLQGTVTFLGWLPYGETRELYRSGDIFVCTSLRDTSGNTVLEAMFAGLPIVLVDWGGPGELVPDDAGIKIRPYSPSQVARDMAAAIEALRQDPDRRRTLGQRGRAAVEESFNWTRRIQEVLSLYEEVAAPVPDGRPVLPGGPSGRNRV